MPTMQHNPRTWHGRQTHDGLQAIPGYECNRPHGIGLRPIMGGTPMPRPMPRAGAFTLMEMTVAIVIMVLIMLAVGVIFQSASRTVGVSQSSMEMNSNQRAIQQQIASDVAGMDRDGFLAIRCATFTDPADVDSSNPGGKAHRCDLVSFISFGSFPLRTGTTSGTPLTDNNTIAPAAFITWGQGAMEENSGTSANNVPTNPAVYLLPDQTYKVPLNQVPTGIESLPTGFTDGALTLCRNAMLLSPKSTSTNNNDPAGAYVAAYQNQTTPLAAIDYSAGSIQANSTFDSGVADITQSRIDLAATTPGQIMSYVAQVLAGSRGGANARYEADHFCYRHAALRSPYDGSNLVNGYFRMTPIALQGVTSFAVDWTDGSVYNGGEMDVAIGQTVGSAGAAPVGATRWYGMYDATHGLAENGSFANHYVDPAGRTVDPGDNRDNYCALFSYDTPRSSWPVALRFRYHISDPANRLQNGRDFVQVVKLPN